MTQNSELSTQNSSFDLEKAKLAVIGLGYVGLPLAAEFGKHRPVVGFDINPKRIGELRNGYDATLEVDSDELKQCTRLSFTSNPDDLADCNVYIVTVPTPIDSHKRPDLTPLLKASETIGKVLKEGDIVIYESTVYPGATEEDCAPILEKHSGLTYINAANCQLQSDGFYLGYSPERINPGDKQHRVTSIKKVTSGSTPEVAEFVDQLYASIITAGTHKAASIKVAEAAKVIENTQRDVNIALINELAILFNKLNIDTLQVLEAAGTKWNFLPFRPGLVGGHCIGVDPYYLTHKAQTVGYHPEMILAGRRLNDNMGAHIVSQLVKAMLKKRIQVEGSRILVMGLTFKENCPDLRNTRVIDIVRELADYNTCVDVYDPWVNAEDARHEYNIELLTKLPSPSGRGPGEGESGTYDAIIIAVGHDQFKTMGPQAIRSLGKENHVLYDIKYLLPPEECDLRL
ncbi:Vi polysaccharide biosynthesis UDP-N-acetylglucosamine C-6 dehydrogenase TviB [Thiohalophilus sp.]|uniref:Vi polysaccharide biosynthesis UDP-N-acetylglucosamine C-6 dehydrogenase TviB n=1 Tax=Thiohalophilus sp. TaxID=3028392 RepID=UPI002ACEA58F|nr:Vi polysaccharide biosynthesis UDP-N-acetylglucosamine C-6 dehydrogenase TviB [Thiohalophilus sp.]MDZ7804381.1 Vi polysaccharide biosynthesis UDP-N-acetylglucosamine C-6 dehydrogenase TviB [Thiohalophilus sp.]